MIQLGFEIFHDPSSSQTNEIQITQAMGLRHTVFPSICIPTCGKLHDSLQKLSGEQCHYRLSFELLCEKLQTGKGDPIFRKGAEKIALSVFTLNV